MKFVVSGGVRKLEGFAGCVRVCEGVTSGITRRREWMWWPWERHGELLVKEVEWLFAWFRYVCLVWRRGLGMRGSRGIYTFPWDGEWGQDGLLLGTICMGK